MLLHGALEGRARTDHLRTDAYQLAQALVLRAHAGVFQRVLHGQQHFIPAQQLPRKSRAPARVASTASAMVRCPEIITAGFWNRLADFTHDLEVGGQGFLIIVARLFLCVTSRRAARYIR